METTINNKNHSVVITPGNNGFMVKVALVMVLFCFIANGMKSANKYKKGYDSLSVLEIEGKMISQDKNNVNDYTVELINKDGSIDTLLLKNTNKFKFVLSKNSNYGIRISKSGYISKLISVNTEMNIESDGIYRFIFETSLLKKEALVHLNKEATDLPIAIIHFDEDNDCFMYNKQYTASVKKEMRKTRSFSKTTPLITTESKAIATTYTD